MYVALSFVQDTTAPIAVIPGIASTGVHVHIGTLYLELSHADAIDLRDQLNVCLEMMWVK